MINIDKSEFTIVNARDKDRLGNLNESLLFNKDRLNNVNSHLASAYFDAEVTVKHYKGCENREWADSYSLSRCEISDILINRVDKITLEIDEIYEANYNTLLSMRGKSDRCWIRKLFCF